jgi:hypothetical protein
MSNQEIEQFLTTITVPLPSKGLLYPKTSPLFGKEQVSVREMTANEEDLLTSLALIRTGKAIDEVVRACIMEPDVDAEKMLVGDRNSIIAGLILASYGSSYKTDVKCENCNETNFKYEFDINNLPIKWLKTQPLAEGVNEFEFELPKSKKKITFKLATAEDEKEITSLIRKMQNSTDREQNVTIRLKRLITSIDGVTDKSKIVNFIEARRLPIMDSVAIRNYIEEISPDIDTMQDFSCKKCGFQGKINMPISFNFFWRA